jgi:phage terminase large subunit
MRRFLAAGYVPQAKQLRFHGYSRLADRADGPDQIAYGGARGGGKSHTVFAQISLDDCQRVPGIKALFLRKVGSSAKEQIEDLRRLVLHSTEHTFNRSGTGEIIFPNGSRIKTGNFNSEKDIDKYLGIEYDIIAIEEANTLTGKKRQAVRNSNRTSKPGFRPRMYLTFNPGGVGHGDVKRDFVKPYRDGTERYTRFVPATVDDNKFVDADYERKLNENTGWMLAAYRYGDFDISAGQYFTNWRHDLHVIKPFDIPLNWPVWGGLDYGFTHPTVAYLATKDSDGNIYLIAEHSARKMLAPQHCEAIKSMAARIGIGWDRVSMFVAGDDVFGKKGAEKTIADQYADGGINLTRANNDRISGASAMLGLLGDRERGQPSRLYVFDRCADFAECMPNMQHDPNRPEDVLKVDADDDGNGGDDAYDAGRYTIMAAEKMGGSFNFSYIGR